MKSFFPLFMIFLIISLRPFQFLKKYGVAVIDSQHFLKLVQEFRDFGSKANKF
jgi:hypothetical protein